MRIRKPRPKMGDIIAIPLDENYFAYARILEEPLMAFYDFRSDGQHPPIEEIVAKPIAFKIWANDEAIYEGRWPIIGHVPLEEELQERVWFYKRDLITNELARYSKGEEFPITFEQCQQLENAAIWRTVNIENRLRDHFAGRPNVTLESFRSQLNNAMKSAK